MPWTHRERFLSVACILLFVLSCFLAYVVLDTSVSLSYARDEQEYRHRQANLLRKLLLDTGKRWNRSELRQLAQERYGGKHIVEEEGDILSVDDIQFVFDGQSLKQINFLNTYQQEDE